VARAARLAATQSGGKGGKDGAAGGQDGAAGGTPGS